MSGILVQMRPPVLCQPEPQPGVPTGCEVAPFGPGNQSLQEGAQLHPGRGSGDFRKEHKNQMNIWMKYTVK